MYSKDSTGFSELLNQWVNFKSFASLYKDCGGSMGVRMFSEHRCEAAAPTKPAGETQRPRSPTVVARRKCLWERGHPFVWVMEERACCRKAAKEGTELLKEKKQWYINEV